MNNSRQNPLFSYYEGFNTNKNLIQFKNSSQKPPRPQTTKINIRKAQQENVLSRRKMTDHRFSRNPHILSEFDSTSANLVTNQKELHSKPDSHYQQEVVIPSDHIAPRVTRTADGGVRQSYKAPILSQRSKE